MRQFQIAPGDSKWPSGLGNFFVCKRFAVQTLLWSLEFVIQINLGYDTIKVLRVSTQKFSRLLGSEGFAFSSLASLQKKPNKVSKNACLFMIFAPYTFPIVIFIIIPPISEFVIILTAILHTTQLKRQELVQTFITTYKSTIDFINLVVNKGLKCVCFYNIFAELPAIFVIFPRPNESLAHWINLIFYRWLLRVLTLQNESNGAEVMT